jgi:hypothetical protein
VFERRPPVTNLPNWTPPLTKLRVYEGVYLLNRRFQATIHAVDRLERLEFFEGDALSSLKSRLEYLRADTNQTLGESVADYEQDEAYRFDQTVRALDDEMKDPDDVFFAARDRKQAVKEQMKDLQRGLDRTRPDKKARRGKKKRKRLRKVT